MATGSKPTPATPGTFDISGEYEAAFNATPARGKAASPSKYLDAIREAIKTGTAKGVTVEGKTDEDKVKHARNIGNELRKGAKQIGKEMGREIKLEQRLRLSHPKLPPFVGFTARVVEPVTVKPAE